MDKSFLSVRYSQISCEAIKNEMMSIYDFGSQIKCSFFRMGMNDIYLINNGNDVYYLRVSLAGVYKYINYAEEAYIVDSLYKNNISVASPIRCKDGSFVWTVKAPEGERFAILFREAKSQPSGDLSERIFNLGSMIAQMHVTADNSNYTISRPAIDLYQLIDEPLELIKKHLVSRNDNYEYLCNSMQTIKRFISDTLPKENPYWGFCHGDIHLSNVNFFGTQPVIFDFDCMGYGWRSHDLAVYLFNHSFGNENYIESDEWKSLLAGYNSVRKLDEKEIKSFPAFCALRSIWVIGVHTKNAEINTGSQIFNDNYFNFFINNFKFWYGRLFK